MKIYDYRYHNNVIHLMDTPTWDNEERTDGEILNDVQQCWKDCALKESTFALRDTAPLDGMIYLHPLSFHHAGYAPRALRIFKLLFSRHTFPYLVSLQLIDLEGATRLTQPSCRSWPRRGGNRL